MVNCISDLDFTYVTYTGALVYSTGFSSNEGELDISFLHQGIFILKVNGEIVDRFVKCDD